MSHRPLAPHPVHPLITSPTCVTADDPTRTCHRHPKSVVDVSCPRGAGRAVGLDRRITTGPHHNNIIQRSFTAPESPIVPIHTSLPQPLGTPDLFMAPPFPPCRIVGIAQCAALPSWLLSLRNPHLRFFCVFSWFTGSFLFTVEYSSMVQRCHS